MIDKKTNDAYQLGTWVGRKQAFSALAGRCSAADAECVRQAWVGKQYRALGMKWDEFCRQRLGLSRATADRIIARLEEFGPSFFILAQATGIGEKEYRRISASVHAQKLLHAGEEIPIDAEHAPRLAAAVEELRRQAPPELPAADSAGSPPCELTPMLEKAERTLASAVDQIARLHGMSLSHAQRERLQRSVVKQLHRIPLFQLAELRRVS